MDTRSIFPVVVSVFALGPFYSARSTYCAPSVDSNVWEALAQS